MEWDRRTTDAHMHSIHIQLKTAAVDAEGITPLRVIKIAQHLFTIVTAVHNTAGVLGVNTRTG